MSENLVSRVNRLEDRMDRKEDSQDALRQTLNENNVLLAKHGLRLDVLEDAENDRTKIVRTARNAIIVGTIGALGAFGKVLWLAIKSLFVGMPNLPKP